jgi:hypothetical protein
MHHSLTDLLCYPSNVQTVPPVPQVRILVRVTRQTPGSEGRNYYVGEKHGRQFSLKCTTSTEHFRDLLHAVRHGTDGFTSPPKEGALRIFFALKKSDGFGRV